jgi:hypothetical protein
MAEVIGVQRETAGCPKPVLLPFGSTIIGKDR